MRIVVGSLFLAGAALLGGGRLPAVSALFDTSPSVALEAASTAQPPARRPVFHTVAAAEPGAEIDTVSPVPRMVPAPLSVTPVPTPNSLATHSKHPGKDRKAAETRPGFKLTCTSAQKFDAARQKCLPKSTATATIHKPRA